MNIIGLGESITPPAPMPALPSGTSAYRLMTGDPSGLLGVVGHTIGRSALVGVGMAVAGERKHLVRNALAGALGIEAFVLVWAAVKAYEAKQAQATGTVQGYFP
jgi:hypothetical protein